MIFGRRRNGGGAAVAGREEITEAKRLEAGGDPFAAIALLDDANRSSRDPELELEIRRLRHIAGIKLLEDRAENPQFARPATELPALGEETCVPEIGPEGLTPELLRGSILGHGCLLVRGLIDPDRALAMAADIDRSFEVRAALGAGGSDAEGFYDELDPEPPYAVTERSWIEQAGGVLACDSPRLMFDMLEAFREAALEQVIEAYLGERPAISAQKCTLRKATPDVSGAWHQDGKFLGPVRSLNVWLSLSRCGDVAPSMDIVPRRIDELVEVGTDGASFSIQVSDEMAARVAGDTGIVRPIFNPGDALLFDELFLHQTGSDPEMPNARYAIESWFFGPSAYPDGYVPIAF
jgi:hypothetical protein